MSELDTAAPELQSTPTNANANANADDNPNITTISSNSSVLTDIEEANNDTTHILAGINGTVPSGTSQDQDASFRMDVDSKDADDTESSQAEQQERIEYNKRTSARIELLKNSLAARNSISASAYTFPPLYSIPQNLVQVSSLFVSPCATHLFSSGSDGYIRKYDWYTSLRKKPDRQPVLKGYWENLSIAAIQSLSVGDLSKAKFGPAGLMGVVGAPVAVAVHSLVVQREEMFCLAGSAEGVINLFGVRLDEGQCRFSLGLDGKGHQRGKPVSALALTHAETEAISGAWDAKVLQWDLNTGLMVRSYVGHSNQIATVAFKPQPGADLPEFLSFDKHDLGVATLEVEDLEKADTKGDVNDQEENKSIEKTQTDEDGKEKDKDSDAASNASYDPLFDDDGDIASIQASNRPSPTAALDIVDTDISLPSDSAGLSLPSLNLPSALQPPSRAHTPLPDAVPAIEVPKPPTLPTITKPKIPSFTDENLPTLGEDVFFSLSVDGECLLWDRAATESNVRCLDIPKGTPTWGIAAAWSASGKTIYAGRRNATVDVYSIQTGSRRTLHLPKLSGKVTALQPLPNNRHLLIASHDTVRLWDLKSGKFTIVPGTLGGLTSLKLDMRAQYLYVAGGGRGWVENGKEEISTFAVQSSQ